MVLLQLFLNGLQLGAIYALTAVGFSLIFGSTKIFHVAHGSAFAISGYIYWWLASKLNVPWPIATLAAVIAAGARRVTVSSSVFRSDEPFAVTQALADALKAADVKVISNAGTPAKGLASVMDLFSAGGGTAVASMLEALAQSDEGRRLLEKFAPPAAPAR